MSDSKWNSRMSDKLQFGHYLYRRLIRFLALPCIPVALMAADLSISRISHRPLNIKPADLGGVVQYGPNGATYFLNTGRGEVRRIADGESSLVRIPLEPSPERATAEVLFLDMAINAPGQLFLGAIWTKKPKGGGAGVIVYNAAGNYERTIVLNPRANIRHLALDASGNIYVLGIEPGYFKGVENFCNLIHKYTPEGNRVTAFSSCPIPAGDRSLGAQWDQLSFEVDRGSIWIQDGRVYQVMPSRRVIRVFDSVTGIAINEITLRPPAENIAIATGAAVAWRVLPMGEGGYLVVWSVPTGMGRTSFVSGHDRNGAATTGWNTPLKIGMPIAAAPNGNAFVLAPERDGAVSLLRGTVRTE
jgi:hypothetical protein